MMPTRKSRIAPLSPTGWLLLGALLALMSTSSSSLLTAQGGGPCAPPTGNPIQCENAKPGNPASEWEVNDAGDPTIQGFATDISVNKGSTISFKVATNATGYRLDIYRLGYYAGLGARKVATVFPSVSLPQNQPNCLSDPSTGLVDCGNWAVSASWLVPSDAVSGFYIARARRNDNGGASHITFIVRDDSGQSDLLFQASDSTWHAYNSYGGNSLYTGAPAGRAYKVSYNRPFNNRGLGGGPRESFLFNAEYPMIRWLEANGYNVSYFTNVDTQRRGAELLEHNVFLSVGHDEYWSAQQRAAVENARDAGVHLAFFSGNEVFWKTRWEPSISSGATPNRTLVTYKETLASAKIDPQPNVWTGTWRDPRFSPPADGGLPENALTGQLFMVNGTRMDSITVPEADGKLRFWRNTSVALLPAGQVATMPMGTLGYEWDVDVDNGFRPAGLIRMSSTTLDVSPLFLLDYGSMYGSGTATHALTLYKNASGALVFGAGTVQWSWGLDPVHDLSGTPSDPRMQQATVNLFADMGVQPLTLQPGLVLASASTDTVAPNAVITSPAGGSSFQVGHVVTISGTATDSGGRVAAIEVSVDGGASWRPALGRENWSFSATFTQTGSATIRVRAVDDSGNIDATPTQVSININPDVTPPVISNVSVTAVFSNWASVSWTTNEPADGQAQYGLTTSYGSFTQLEPALTTSHVAYFIGLQPNTTYHFRARSRDVGGLLTTSNDLTFTTASGSAVQVVTFDDLPGQTQPLDGQYPTGLINWGTGQWWHSEPWGAFTTKSVGFNGPGISSASMTFVSPLRLLRFDAYNGGGESTTVSVSCPSQPTVQSVVPAGQIRTIASGWAQTCPSATISSSNGWSTNFDNLEFDAPADGAAPQISGIAVDPGPTSATVQWVTNEPADGQVDYGLTPSYGSSTPVAPALTTSHSLVVSGLTPSTTYYYRIRSRDSGGNLATSPGGTFTTDPPDSVAPLLSSIQVTLVTNTSARVTWISDENADTQVEYGATTAYGTLSPLDSTPTMGHAVVLSGLTSGTTYHYRVRSRDTTGNLAVSADKTFSTSGPGLCPCSIWPLTAAPAVPSQSDTNPVELGVRFRADVDGLINGVRFYKGPTNTGLHTVTLWSNGGTSLATATVAFESATGWQEVAFASPVAVTANTTYVASYFAPNGGYAVTLDAFYAPVNSPPLHALQDGVDGRSGVYRYMSSGFPMSTYQASNYWVDVVFVPTPDTTGPAITNVIASAASTTAIVTWTTNEPANSQVEYGLTTSYGSLSSLSSTLTTAHNVGLSGLAAGTTYHYRVRSRDAAGNLSMSANQTFTTSSPDVTPPALSSIQASLVTASTARVTWTTNEAADTQVEYGLTTAYGTQSTLVTTLSTDHVVDLAGLSAATTYHYRVRSRDASGNLALSTDQTFTTSAAGVCPCSVWPPTATPAVAAANDPTPIEVGMRFRSDQTGHITRVRFYKGTGNTGTHVGHLWTNTGTLLATATFSNETASGWQEASFPSPVAITAGTTYVVSYFAPNGRYAQTVGGLSGGVAAAPLHALADGVAGGNGVYLYGSSGFPNSSWGGSNYWVDVVFAPASDTTPPVISAVQSKSDSTSAVVSWTTSEPADGQVEYGTTTSYGSTSSLVTALTLGHSIGLPGLAPSTTYFFRVRSRDGAGNLALATGSFATPAVGVCPCSLFPLASTPAVASSTDTGALELGVRFQATQNGYIRGVRFYKGAANTGQHVAHLWTATGTLLATATFSNESATGWQEVMFASPVAITANTIYVASYFAPQGGYSVNSAYFGASVNSPPLVAPAGTNGVYQYGPSGGFPNSSFNSTNYWVDVVFTQVP
jgi:phosphodiesterase/alkaline phosphatase D-like protein